MISRMILVGLVAVLGVSLPSRSESGGWLTSAHEWMIAQLAEWDTDTPREVGGIIVTETPNPSPRQATQAAGCTNTTTKVAFDPIPVADYLANWLADELNRLSEGLDIPAATTVAAESPTDFVTVSPSDPIELKLTVELCRIAEASRHDETVSAPATPEPREAEADPTIVELFADGSQMFAPPEQELPTIAQPEPASIAARPTSVIPEPREAEADPAIDELFANGSQVFAPAEQELPTIAQPEPASIAARPTFEPIQPPADFETDIAAELSLCGEGIETAFEDAPPRSEPMRTFEPIKVPADLESGIAYELNRASEGRETTLPEVRRLGEARPRMPGSEPAVHPEDNPKDARIGKALGLTRDAALAWMNVLTGTTPVMMTSQ